MAHLSIGARLAGRLQLGFGFGYNGMSWVVGDQLRVRTDGLNFIPSLSVDLVKSKDERVALMVLAALSFGATLSDTLTGSPNTLGPLDEHFVLGCQLAVGVRYAPHPMVAIGAESGYLGLFVDPGPGRIENHDFYAALNATFYYGK